MYIDIHVYIHLYMYIFIYILVHVNIFICVYIHLHDYMYIHIHIYMCIHIYIYIFICNYLCADVYRYTELKVCHDEELEKNQQEGRTLFESTGDMHDAATLQHDALLWQSCFRYNFDLDSIHSDKLSKST